MFGQRQINIKVGLPGIYYFKLRLFFERLAAFKASYPRINYNRLFDGLNLALDRIMELEEVEQAVNNNAANTKR